MPQAPILFDDTIMNNVRYSRITASDEEVYAACRAACVHDKIISFTQGRSAPLYAFGHFADNHTRLQYQSGRAWRVSGKAY